MTARRQNTAHSFFAMLCLIAVFLLYAPLGGAAWYVYSGACCTAGQCPIHGHHDPHSLATPEHTMNCGHDILAMTQCRMDCCHHPDRPVLAPMIFVLPAPVNLTAPTSFEALTPSPASQNTFSSTEPLSPPPRISLAA